MTEVDYALLALRVWAGVVMLAHGINHGRSLEGTANWFEKKGWRAPRLNAMLSSASEVAVGLGLIVGLLTSIAAAALAATMVAAFWTVHRFSGFFVFRRPDEGYEYVATLAVVAFAVAVIGPGGISLDAVFGLDESLTGPTGALIFAGGLLAGVGQVAALWRKPAPAAD
ncbi:MAG: DoxX family protein [Acidimicrobiia bacterium]|nr:DoxX family protein [Acidimicrobiia bacterium]